MGDKSTDRIEEKIFLRASRARVWRALADAREFGAWFDMRIEGTFEPGATVKGMPTAEVHEGVPIEMAVERVEPRRLFSWRWHPYAMDPGRDYSAETPTLVECRLEETDGGTLLAVAESGFDGLPDGRREEAYRAHEEGWPWKLKAIEGYLARAA